MSLSKPEPGLPNGWTPGRLQGFLIGVLRAGHKRWPIKLEVKNEAKTDKRINPATGRMAQFYLCSVCCHEYTNHDVEVDHVDPVVDPVSGFHDWNTYINRLFSSKENYQLLCKSCHKEKTDLEKKLKKELKANART